MIYPIQALQIRLLFLLKCRYKALSTLYWQIVCKQHWSVRCTDSLNTDHVFPVGSVSKTITSACIVSMVDEGLLSLNDTIGTWISGYPQIDGNITVYQLLNHTSGIYNFTAHPNYGSTINNTLGTTYTMTDMLDNFLDDPYFDAGEGWEYSNTNYLLADLRHLVLMILCCCHKNL